MSIRLQIMSAIQQIAVEQNIDLPPLHDDLTLRETGFESLAFAILVVSFDDDLGIDPFSVSADATFLSR